MFRHPSRAALYATVLVGVGGVFVFPQFEADDRAIAHFKLGDPVVHEFGESGGLDFLDVAEANRSLLASSVAAMG